MSAYQLRQLAGMNAVAAGLPEGKKLHILSMVFEDRLYQAQKATQSRRVFLQLIRDCAEDGMVAVIESGMDCDSVRYSGHRSLVEATAAAVDAHIEHQTHWADGPIYFDIERPSVLVEYESRDLGMEAFENGHPHFITEAE